MDTQRIQLLVEKYIEGTATAQEIAELQDWYRASNNQELEWPEEKEAVRLRMLARIKEQTSARTRSLWPRIAAAASILVLLGTGAYFVLHKNSAPQFAQTDVAPFSKQAILKTGHGKALQLDSTRKGLLAKYANTNINTANNAVTYTNNATAETNAVFDTLQVPAGGKPYHLKLADGSEVIINVASALRFPENFRKNNNEVELLSGEAYFDVVHNAKSPILIKAKAQIINDIGTQFDVNTYADETDSRTTLVDGAVNVNGKRLHPGQQAIVNASSLTIANADIEQTTSWVHGYFRFNGEDIQTIMRQLARWYNIEVKYEGVISKEGYYVKISRSRNISDVLRVLERTNSVHFKIEGRRVTVSSKK